MNGGANKGPPQPPSGPIPMVYRWRSRDKVQRTHTNTPTHKGSNNNVVNKGTPWANVLRIFSQAPVHRRALDTERLRRFAPNSAPHYLKGSNEERERRLQVVKLLTALSYCGGS